MGCMCRVQEDPLSFSADLVPVSVENIAEAVRWVQGLSHQSSAVSQSSVCDTLNSAMKLNSVCSALLIILQSSSLCISLPMNIIAGTHSQMKKKRSERRKHCTLAVIRRSQNFRPAAYPLSGAKDGQNLIS